MRRRQTKKIKTESGKVVVVYSYITAGEQMEMQRILFGEGSTLEKITKSGGADMEMVVLLDAQKFLAKKLVVSVGRDKKASLLDLPAPDAQKVLDELQRMAFPSVEDKKK